MAANGRKYGFSGSITGAATKSIVGIAATTAVRPYVLDIMISSNATPADNSSEWWVLRFTVSATTCTVVTPALFDSGDPAAASVAWKNATGEPTYGAVPVLDIAHNQRATFRWVAAPGEEIISPATAANGVGVQCQGVGGSGVVEICSVKSYAACAS